MRWQQVCATGWQSIAPDDWRIGRCLVDGVPHYALYRADERMGIFATLEAAQVRADEIESSGGGEDGAA